MNKGIKKIILSTNEWFTNEKYRKFGVDKIIEAGYEIEIWNSNKLIFNLIPEKPSDLYKGEVRVKDFETRDELREALHNCSKETLILNYYPDFSDLESICEHQVKYFNIYGGIMLCDQGIENLNFYYNNFIQIGVHYNWRDRLHRTPSLVIGKERKKAIQFWPPLKNIIASPADFYPLCRLVPHERLLMLHSYNYDRYLQDNNKNSDNGGYLLFIDEAVGIHPEEYQFGIVDDEADIKKYRESMIEIFDQMENYYGIKTIIAAHPKAEYKGGEYGEREIIYFNSYELIKHANVVIQHVSTMTDMITLFKKPFLSVTAEILNRRKHDRKIIQRFKKYFGCKVYFAGKEKDEPWKYVYCDYKKYEKFVKDFVVYDKNEKRTFIQAILDEIEKIECL